MKILAQAILVGSLILMTIFGVFAFVGWSATQAQCPDGNDCGDALTALYLGMTVALISAAVFFGAALFLRKPG
ncbi:MAG TPA: hypothetical protein VMF90_07300 [Rhizobiaceae bacterium]|nr:hypothetical protein [Rhizobiaceae bacterium]